MTLESNSSHRAIVGLLIVIFVLAIVTTNGSEMSGVMDTMMFCTPALSGDEAGSSRMSNGNRQPGRITQRVQI